jgi:hypothetical protein
MNIRFTNILLHDVVSNMYLYQLYMSHKVERNE